ncbi:MAG: hypothetical protein BWK78_04620 [Thiotrichaceae bacterium IS1]|nr:MAG: hypothetical protein BWK78_04620 [Thiotrichaceae bacterium IS1]
MTLKPNLVHPGLFWRWWLQVIEIFVVSMFLLYGTTVGAVEITNAKGPPDLFEKGNGEKVKLYSLLKVGEKLCVLEPKDLDTVIIGRDYGGKLYLEVSLDNGTKKFVSVNPSYLEEKDKDKYAEVKQEGGKEWCYEIPQQQPVPQHDDKDTKKKVENAKRVGGDFLTSLLEPVYDWLTAGSKGDDTSATEIPILGTMFYPAKLVVGKSKLHLAWEGKEGISYWVQIFLKGGDNRLLQEGVVKKPEIVFQDNSSFAVGQKYTVTVRYGECGIVKGAFEVVDDLKSVLSSDEMDKITAIETTAGSLSSEEKEVLVASLLVQNGLLLEAYQRIATQQSWSANSLKLSIIHRGIMEKTKAKLK